MLYMNIFFEDMSYTVIEQLPDYTASELQGKYIYNEVSIIYKIYYYFKVQNNLF